jgi:hypothetical protein
VVKDFGNYYNPVPWTKGDHFHVGYVVLQKQ